jgi:hypothetical protein
LAISGEFGKIVETVRKYWGSDGESTRAGEIQGETTEFGFGGFGGATGKAGGTSGNISYGLATF